MVTIKAILFDAYGTLFDVYSVTELAERLYQGSGARLAELWRERQLEYSRLRTLSGRYAPFSEVTAQALRFAVKRLGLASNPDHEQQLLEAYGRLALFPENDTALAQLAAMGLSLSILSNGDSAMLLQVVEHAGLRQRFEHILSADAVRRFKTAPEVYQLGLDATGLARESILFVSSNCWDACGAAWFGLTTFWINRSGQPVEELGISPEGEGASMHELVQFVRIINSL